MVIDHQSYVLSAGNTPGSRPVCWGIFPPNGGWLMVVKGMNPQANGQTAETFWDDEYLVGKIKFKVFFSGSRTAE